MNKQLLDKLKDTSILIAWIFGLILISCLCWVLSKPVRTDFLRRSINNALIYSANSQQLGQALPPGSLNPGLEHLGVWYALDNGSKAVIFSIIADGIFLPCAVIVNTNGKVQELIPLSSSGRKILNRISPGIIQLYIKRIEHGFLKDSL